MVIANPNDSTILSSFGQTQKRCSMSVKILFFSELFNSWSNDKQSMNLWHFKREHCLNTTSAVCRNSSVQHPIKNSSQKTIGQILLSLTFHLLVHSPISFSFRNHLPRRKFAVIFMCNELLTPSRTIKINHRIVQIPVDSCSHQNTYFHFYFRQKENLPEQLHSPAPENTAKIYQSNKKTHYNTKPNKNHTLTADTLNTGLFISGLSCILQRSKLKTNKGPSCHILPADGRSIQSTKREQGSWLNYI